MPNLSQHETGFARRLRSINGESIMFFTSELTSNRDRHIQGISSHQLEVIWFQSTEHDKSLI
jgi:hypothetical protein